MNDQDYTTTISVDRTPEEVFDAINDVRGWWSEDIEGSTGQLGAEFTFRGKDIHRSRIKVTELVRGRQVSWLVLDNYMNYVKDQSEWTGTQIRFDISAESSGTQICFSHLGLVPADECFDVCSGAWGYFIGGSLRNLITTGQGQPMSKG